MAKKGNRVKKQAQKPRQKPKAAAQSKQMPADNISETESEVDIIKDIFRAEFLEDDYLPSGSNKQKTGTVSSKKPSPKQPPKDKEKSQPPCTIILPCVTEQESFLEKYWVQLLVGIIFTAYVLYKYYG